MTNNIKERLRDARDAQTHDSSVMRALLADAYTRIERLEEKNYILTEMGDYPGSIRAAVEERVVVAHAAMIELKKELAQTRVSRVTMEGALQEVTRLTARVDELSKINEAVVEERAAWEKGATRLREELTVMSKSRDEMAAAYSAEAERANELTGKVNDWKTSAMLARTDYNSTMERVVNLEAELSNTQELNVKLHTRIDKEMGDNDRYPCSVNSKLYYIPEEVRRELYDRGDEVKGLTALLEVANSGARDRSDELAGAREEVVSLQASMRELVANRDIWRDRSERVEAESITLHTGRADDKDVIKGLRSRIAMILEAKERARAQLHDSKLKREELSEKIAILREEALAHATINEAANSTVLKLREELALRGDGRYAAGWRAGKAEAGGVVDRMRTDLTTAQQTNRENAEEIGGLRKELLQQPGYYTYGEQRFKEGVNSVCEAPDGVAELAHVASKSIEELNECAKECSALKSDINADIVTRGQLETLRDAAWQHVKRDSEQTRYNLKRTLVRSATL